MVHSSQFLQIVKQAKQRIQELSVRELKDCLNRGDDIWIIDVREQREWQQGHIENAIHLSKGIIERDIENTITDKKANIVLYCGGGFRSALAAENLQKMGYCQVWSLAGGYRAWVTLESD